MEALLTANNNFLVRDKERSLYGYFTQEGVFLKWSTPNEFDWAVRTWDREIVIIPGFLFPDPDNKLYFDDLIILFLKEKGIEINQNALYKSPEDFVIPYWFDATSLTEIKKYSNEEREYYENNNVRSRDVFNILVIEINNQEFSVLERQHSYYETPEDIEAIWVEHYTFTLIRGNFFKKVKDEEEQTKAFLCLFGEKILAEIE